MEQLFSTFGINTPLLLTQAVNFGIALVVLWLFLFKPVVKIIGERQEKIRKGIEDAEKAAKKAEETERDRTDVMAKAEREAESMMERAVAEGKKERAGIVERAQSQGDSILSDARLQADEISRKAMKETEKEIAKTAILAAEKILQAK